MSVPIPALAPEELAQLRAVHAHRFPRTAKIPVRGDHGEPLKLQVVLGNPTGARPTDGKRPSPVWAKIVRGLIFGGYDRAAACSPLVSDCLLWPDARTFAAWAARWPGLPGDVGVAILRMIGAFVEDALVEPTIEQPPEAIDAALAAHPRAVWRRLMPPGSTFDVVIDAPDSVAYDAFADAIGRDGEDPVALVRDFALGHVRACLAIEEEGAKSTSVAEVIARYPGLSILVAAQARKLANAAGEIELGE